MSAKTQAASSGIGFGGLLTLVFVAAKLWDKIDWSWPWVFAPLWMPALAAIGILIMVLAIAGIVWLVASGIDATARKKRIRLRDERRSVR